MAEDNSKEKVIPLKSSDLEEEFNKNIAIYGYKKDYSNSDEVKGAKETEKKLEETYRTNLRRQRDKILYTGGFRRLQDKTQVMSATLSGDHRTRLTHTLEVEQIAISIANALKLNVDLVSAIALGHDVGHTPFGHAAERKLNELLEDNGKFHHPIQSIRYIWEKYGSKIEDVIYEGILLHDSDMFNIDKEEVKKQLKYLKEVEGEKEEFRSWVDLDKWLKEFPSTLEAQVVIWADKIAYITHDLEDFLRSSIYINLQKNDDKIENKIYLILNKIVKDLKKMKDFELRDLIRNIINNLIETSAENILKISDFTQEKVKEETKNRSEKDKNKNENKRRMYLNSLIINLSDEYRQNYYELREFLDRYYIFSPEVQKSDVKAEIIVETLFNTLKSNYKLMPLDIRDDIDKAIENELKTNNDLKLIYNNSPEEPKSIVQFEKDIEKCKDVYDKYYIIKDKIISRKVAVYIATMTDTYAESMYRDLIGSRVDFIL